ncbi:MAG: hypothetical protein HY925_14475 [Elusimicrobia bacterium]|nr:hypothetical protein [Elusimicrobiota bacterium]
MKQALLAAALLSGCGGHRLHEISPEKFPVGDYAPAPRAPQADSAAVRAAVEEAFTHCRESVLAAYEVRLKSAEVFDDSIRLEGEDARGESHAGMWTTAAPLPRLDKKRVLFPPFYSVWDVKTRYSAELEVECNSPEAARRVIDTVADLRALPSARSSQSAEFDKNLEKYLAQKNAELSDDAKKAFAQADEAYEAKKWADAVAFYGKVSDLAPWRPEPYDRRARALGELERWEEAIASMERFLALQPDASASRAAKDLIFSWEGKRR